MLGRDCAVKPRVPSQGGWIPEERRAARVENVSDRCPFTQVGGGFDSEDQTRRSPKAQERTEPPPIPLNRRGENHGRKSNFLAIIEGLKVFRADGVEIAGVSGASILRLS